MPKKKEELNSEEVKEAKKKVTSTAKKKTGEKTGSKTTKKTSTSKKVDNAKKTTVEKKVSTKAKATPKKAEIKKSTNSSTKKATKSSKVTPIKDTVKEETIIEKIKSFIAKIAAMQEEAKKEALGEKEVKKSKKESRSKKSESSKVTYLAEYYDLPYRYNETVVKILAQTPKRIFVYWDVADEDIQRYRNAFGDDFFEKTYPVLLLHNDDKNYTIEIPINDFANSWYIDIQDPKTKYTIQLGRKFKEVPRNVDTAKINEHRIILRNDYLPIAQSNRLEVPNDHILFETMPNKITFRNVKNYEEYEKTISEIKTPIRKLYDVKEFYKEAYKEEIDEEIFDLNNPTSGGLSSSSFK